jgi:hypothetical protein
MHRLIHGSTLCLAVVFMTASAAAQSTNPRFGQWKLKSDAPAPQSNVMTYEPFGAKGMKVTVTSVNARGDTTSWWYTTAFDGKDMPVTGNRGTTHTSVRTLDDRVNEIINKRDGRVTQVLTNVLSPDGNTIAVIYMRADSTGKTTGVTFATYERIK